MAALVAGVKIEDPALPVGESHAAAEHVAAREPADEHHVVRARDIEILAVHLLPLQRKHLRHAGGDGVGGGSVPHIGLFVPVPPHGGTAGAHHRLPTGCCSKFNISEASV